MAIYRRKTFLINKQFQLRLSAYVFGLVLTISFIYPLIIYYLFNYFTNYLRLDPNGPDLRLIEDTRAQVLTLLVTFQVLFLAISFLASVFISHRVAGPLFKLQKFMQMAIAGDFKGNLTFRDKDYFPEIAVDYNHMINKVQEELEKRDRLIRDVIADLENRNTDSALHKLRQTQ